MRKFRIVFSTDMTTQLTKKVKKSLPMFKLEQMHSVLVDLDRKEQVLKQIKRIEDLVIFCNWIWMTKDAALELCDIRTKEEAILNMRHENKIVSDYCKCMIEGRSYEDVF